MLVKRETIAYYHASRSRKVSALVKTLLWAGVYLGFLVWSAIEPKDRFTWWLEALPAIAGLVILVFTRKTFPLTGILYLLILAHAIVLVIGAHYTYAEVPWFDALKPVFGWERNNFDKLGHFMQGFMPAILAREILIRKEVVNGSAWRVLIVLSICLAFSAFYELIEWVAALLSGESATAFLGTQGYVWDTQSDMAWALFGASMALLLLSRLHDRQLAALKWF